MRQNFDAENPDVCRVPMVSAAGSNEIPSTGTALTVKQFQAVQDDFSFARRKRMRFGKDATAHGYALLIRNNFVSYGAKTFEKRLISELREMAIPELGLIGSFGESPGTIRFFGAVGSVR